MENLEFEVTRLRMQIEEMWSVLQELADSPEKARELRRRIVRLEGRADGIEMRIEPIEDRLNDLGSP